MRLPQPQQYKLVSVYLGYECRLERNRYSICSACYDMLGPNLEPHYYRAESEYMTLVKCDLYTHATSNVQTA